MVFAIHWHESAMDLHVFPIPLPTPTSLSIPTLWVFPVHQPWALVSCIQPGLVICFTLDSILVSMLFSQNIPPSPSPTESQSLFRTSVSLFLFCVLGYHYQNWCFWTMVLEKTLERPLDCKEIQPVHPKGDQSWVFIGRTDAEAQTPILWPPHVKRSHWKRPWFWEGLGAGGEGDSRRWDGWVASPTRWAWVWVNSGSWWWIGSTGVLRFMGSQRAGHDSATELNWSK